MFEERNGFVGIEASEMFTNEIVKVVLTFNVGRYMANAVIAQ